jgi:non-ribosomal peptide synthase protein (TIGR01720 family)
LLQVNAVVTGGRLRVSWTYSDHQHRLERIRTLAESFLASLRDLLTHCQRPDAGGYTPSDFPLAELDSDDLARISRLLRTDASRK